MEKKQLTDTEAKERDDRLQAAGITVMTEPGTATITLLAKRTSADPLGDR